MTAPSSPVSIGDRRSGGYGLWALALPWVRMELPGWGKLFRLARVDFKHNAVWSQAGWREIRCKGHGFRVRLDLSAAFDRATFFLGRYAELDTELVMRQILRPGDQFIDGGANIGLLSLTAAYLVGATGRVHAFEPNPAMHERVLEHLRLNDLVSRVVVHQLGLSDREATLQFRIIDGGAESGTVAKLSDDVAAHVTQTMSIRVVPGDSLLADSLTPDRRTLIKLDVEGHEPEALRGLLKTVDRLRAAVITENHPRPVQRRSPV
jgi:FkbM family methyltransferase